MLNFRKLLHDFSQVVVKEGRHLLEQGRVSHCHVESIKSNAIKLGYQVEGAFQHAYHGHLDVDIQGSEILYGDCECSKKYDCEHIAAACLYLEAHYDQILASYATQHEEKVSPDAATPPPKAKKDSTDQKVQTALKRARENAAKKASQVVLQETLQEYRHAQKILENSAFFEEATPFSWTPAELLLFLHPTDELSKQGFCEIQIILRIDSRAKPIHVANVKEFFEAIEFEQPQLLASRQHWLSYSSFSDYHQKLLRLLSSHIQEADVKDSRTKSSRISLETLGAMLALAREQAAAFRRLWRQSDETPSSVILEVFYLESLETPLKLSQRCARFCAKLHGMDLDHIKIMLDMGLILDDAKIALHDVILLAALEPGLLHKGVYYPFDKPIQRRHLKAVQALQDLVIPQPLIGTLLEIGLPTFKKICSDVHIDNVKGCDTLPCEPPKARCEITYAAGKMEVEVIFLYGKRELPAVSSRLELSHIESFITDSATMARDIWYEKNLLEKLFADFQCDETKGVFIARSDRAIVDFMTRLVPALRPFVEFVCPSNLLEQFVYDTTQISFHAKPLKEVHEYAMDLEIKGPLEGVTLSQIWDCLGADRPYLELHEKSKTKGSRPKILVLDLAPMRQLARFMDDLGIEQFTGQTYRRPLWTLSHLEPDYIKNLPFKVEIDEALKDIQEQLWGRMTLEPQAVPKEVCATLRGYQLEGVHWLEKLRRMHLAGILADDMGLGKTVQAIVAISQLTKEKSSHCSLVLCPTSLVYNWKEEVTKFNPKLRIKIIDGTPVQRKKSIEELTDYDLAITSYSLLQKDIDTYQQITLGYIILDEAQSIKNRQTQNAKCVRLLKGKYRLAMTGTPVENSLDELWSLFDFLMPGLMSSYERFVEKYMKKSSPALPGSTEETPLQQLRRRITPFVLRRMKSDVLEELPPVNEIVYHCELADKQRELYIDYAKTARQELSAMVERDGFDKVRIHVLATLTRLKQICCHPAIFTGEAQPSESAKYELFWQVIENILFSGRKAVIFSQYTKMLAIMRRDLDERAIAYCYLDGSTKNRMDEVRKFNESPEIPFFLVSLKAGGTGLNLTGADTVIHYDLWWNPAVEDQATDRVHRMGQKARVSSYKLVTLGTIEEKIVELQNRKKGLVRQLVVDDEEAIEKLTWEEVLQLLQT